MNFIINILIPTYNSQDSLDLCIKSCIQGCSDLSKIKIIIGDDNYPEINSEILSKWENNVEVVTFGQNVGLPHMTNTLVSQIENDDDWFLLVNDDNVFDWYWDKKLTKFGGGYCVSINQIEPYQSIFREFIIKDLGRNPKDFNLEKFWNFTKIVNHITPNLENSGGTLPLFMKKVDFMKVGGWDVSYPTNGIVADVDFFHKCKLSGLKLVREYSTHFYHFVSLSSPTKEQKEKRWKEEEDAWVYANMKWKGNLKHHLL